LIAVGEAQRDVQTHLATGAQRTIRNVVGPVAQVANRGYGGLALLLAHQQRAKLEPRAPTQSGAPLGGGCGDDSGTAALGARIVKTLARVDEELGGLVHSGALGARSGDACETRVSARR
jgi:hypothetical protein